MPYAIGIIRYRRPLEEVLSHVDAHRAYLHGLHEQGIVLVAPQRPGGSAYPHFDVVAADDRNYRTKGTAVSVPG